MKGKGDIVLYNKKKERDGEANVFVCCIKKENEGEGKKRKPGAAVN